MIYQQHEQNVIIAYQLNGQPLPEILRLILPNENGDRWISLITQILAISTLIFTPEKQNSQQTMFREAAKSLITQPTYELPLSNNESNLPPLISSPKETDNSTIGQKFSLKPNLQIESSNTILVTILLTLIIGIVCVYTLHRQHKKLTK